jgi:hypothetical protein
MARSLTDQERAVIERLLAAEVPGAAGFIQQLRYASVESECSCGCGTIDLRVDRTAVPPAAPDRWAEEMGPFVEGDETSWLMLFQDGGYLTCLEHVPGYGAKIDALNAEEIRPKPYT